MSTVNMKKVDETYEYDPFSEYTHQTTVTQQEQVEQPIAAVQPLQQKEQLLKNIDDMFDGADFVFNIANKFMQRLGGK